MALAALRRNHGAGRGEGGAWGERTTDGEENNKDAHVVVVHDGDARRLRRRHRRHQDVFGHGKVGPDLLQHLRGTKGTPLRKNQKKRKKKKGSD